MEKLIKWQEREKKNFINYLGIYRKEIILSDETGYN